MDYEKMTIESLAHHCARYSNGKLEKSKLIEKFTSVCKPDIFDKITIKLGLSNIEKVADYCFNTSGYALNKADLKCRLTHLFEKHNKKK